MIISKTETHSDKKTCTKLMQNLKTPKSLDFKELKLSSALSLKLNCTKATNHTKLQVKCIFRNAYNLLEITSVKTHFLDIYHHTSVIQRKCGSLFTANKQYCGHGKIEWFSGGKFWRRGIFWTGNIFSSWSFNLSPN